MRSVDLGWTRKNAGSASPYPGLTLGDSSFLPWMSRTSHRQARFRKFPSGGSR